MLKEIHAYHIFEDRCVIAMSLHTDHPDLFEVYFCTVTCFKWLPLIEEANAYKSVYRWFSFLKHDGCKLLGYVIMPNHFHVLLYPTHTGTSINQLIGDCKRFMAYDIVHSLKTQQKDELLRILQKAVPINERKKGKLHQVFKPSFDARACYDEKMVEDKLDYIHHNPVRGKWMLTPDWAIYPHSSAAFYERGLTSDFEIVHYKDL
jgi:REP element-mobilizing transposase RayT